MPILDSRFFAGTEAIPDQLVKRLLTPSLGDRVTDCLTGLGWEGQIIAAVGLTLSVDGQRVENAEFFMRGELLHAPVQISANKLFEGAEKEVMLSITIPEAQLFNFKNGTLCSEFLPGDAVNVQVSRHEEQIAVADWAAYNVHQFCLRLICYLDKSSNAKRGRGPHIKFTILLFPQSVDELAERSGATQAANWPGIKIAEGNCGFFPEASAGAFGMPLLPILCTRQRAENSVSVPSLPQLRFAIAETMRTAALPVVCATRAALVKKAQETVIHLPRARTPTITWPTEIRPQSEKGKV